MLSLKLFVCLSLLRESLLLSAHLNDYLEVEMIKLLFLRVMWIFPHVLMKWDFYN